MRRPQSSVARPVRPWVVEVRTVSAQSRSLPLLSVRRGFWTRRGAERWIEANREVSDATVRVLVRAEFVLKRRRWTGDLGEVTPE